jgi:signal transduction histidine kinase
MRVLIAETIAMTEPMFDERGHRVACALGDAPAWIVGDAIRLKQVFSNLLRNAASYTPPNGNVRLSLDADECHVRVRIRDNGAGIPAESLDDVFELFNRGGRPNTGQSAGIGLAVVRRLVELHGGTVSASSDGPGRGSEFTVLLPRSR